MIVQTAAGFRRSAYFQAQLTRALSWLGQRDLTVLPSGRTEIDGDSLFAVVQRYGTADENTLLFERHLAYADVQYMVQGQEKILLCSRSRVGETAVPYDPEGDIVFFRDPLPPVSSLILSPGQYAVFFPDDCHKTRCSVSAGTSEPVLKVIVKIKLQEEFPMDTQNTAFHHLCIRASDYEASKRFYTEVLGGECYAEWLHRKGFMACMMRLPGGGIIEMLGSGEGSLPEQFESIGGCFIHLALRVNDVEAAVEKALLYGARKKGEITDNFVPEPLHIGAVYGPSGEIIEFLRPIE